MTALASLLMLLAGLAAGGARAQAQAQSAAAGPPPLSIAVLVSSRTDQCYDSGEVAAIKRLASAEANRINASGGLLRRPLQLEFLDDDREPEKLVGNVRSALANPGTVAIVGLANSNNAKVLFDRLGNEIGASGIPFLSDLSLTSLFETFGNVFTTRASQDAERIPVLAEFMKSRFVTRPAFVGLADSLFSTSYADGLKSLKGEAKLVADHRLKLDKDKLDPTAIAAVVADLKQKETDLVFLAVGSQRTAAVLAAFAAAGLRPPVFVSGRIETILEAGAPEYPGDIFQFAWDDLPGVYSDRLRDRIARNGLDSWIFEGAKVSQAPGWASGACKARPEGTVPDVFDRRNMLAIGRGTQHGDMVALVAEALKSADPKADIARLRGHILKQLKTSYAAGTGAFRGSFENWSFRPDSRTADRTPFIVMRPNGLGASQLAPDQFVRLRSDQLLRVSTLYLDIDLIRTFRVDDNEKSFYAEFYLSMRGQNATIKSLEFANAFLDPRTNDRQITVKTLHEGGPSGAYPSEMKIYHVAGKFMFEPRLANYPFDQQSFAINIQPRSGDAPFIVQPPPAQLRDTAVATDGWDLKEQYVSYDEDFVPTIDAWTLQQSVVPFYKASYVWVMKRQTTDYYLRVVVPLGFILIVAYLSIFIPQTHFEAIVTIQVTALLSAVALYLALPKLDADSATLSDKIFIFTYMAVSLMIGLSILRVNSTIAHAPVIRTALGVVYMTVIPILIGAMAFYVYTTSLAH